MFSPRCCFSWAKPCAKAAANGALVFAGALVVALSLWLALSFLGEWRKPPLGFLLLIGLQFFGWAFHEANTRAVSQIEYSISVVQALRVSWEALTLSQRIATVVALVFALAILWFWGAGIEARATKWSGPQKAQGFLRKRKSSYRLGGALLMALAFVATGVVGALLFASSLHLNYVALPPNFALTPQLAFVLCVSLDAIYWHGRNLWRRLA